MRIITTLKLSSTLRHWGFLLPGLQPYVTVIFEFYIFCSHPVSQLAVNFVFRCQLHHYLFFFNSWNPRLVCHFGPLRARERHTLWLPFSFSDPCLLITGFLCALDSDPDGWGFFLLGEMRCSSRGQRSFMYMSLQFRLSSLLSGRMS